MGDGDVEIVLDPKRVAETVVRPKSDSEVGGGMLLEIGLPVILHSGIAAVEISAGREEHDLGIKAVGESTLVGAIESGLAVEQLPVQFGDLRLAGFADGRKVSGVVFQIHGGAPVAQQVAANNAVHGATAGASDG